MLIAIATVSKNKIHVFERGWAVTVKYHLNLFYVFGGNDIAVY